MSRVCSSHALDSGCINYIVNQDKHFNRCVILKESIKVRGDGRILEVTKIGSIETYFTNKRGKSH